MTKTLNRFSVAFQAVFGLTAAVSHDAANATAPTATIKSGPIIGVTTHLPNAVVPVNKFLGIPYAEARERFSMPEHPKRWMTPRKATNFSAACVQFFLDSSIGNGPDKDVLIDVFDLNVPQSEDCLYINAFTPATPGPKDGRPIVLFIPGGAWQMGNGLADLSGFAGYEDIIVMSFNYRINIFGFPSSPDIPPQERNLGLHDQRMAIEWVKANAKSFGGDPEKITIWGESAGSISVDIHMLAYAKAERPPFRAGIMSSGQMSIGLNMATGYAGSEDSWTSIARAAGCGPNGTLSCMRKIPAKKLQQLQSRGMGAFFPNVDNKTIFTGREEAWRRGDVAKVPMLMSTTAEEGKALIGRSVSMAKFESMYLPEPIVTKKQLFAILDYYKKLPHLDSDFDLQSAICTDFLSLCPQAQLADLSASIGNPTWLYQFNMSIVELLPKKFDWLGKYHGSDVYLSFLAPSYDKETNSTNLFTPELYAFANFYRSMIARFVKNPVGGTGWPAVGSRFAPLDVASLGDVESVRTSGATPVNRTVLLERCSLFKDIYPVIEKAFP